MTMVIAISVRPECAPPVLCVSLVARPQNNLYVISLPRTYKSATPAVLSVHLLHVVFLNHRIAGLRLRRRPIS